MNCPTCGAPGVMIRGAYWECGECGDCGRLARHPRPSHADTGPAEEALDLDALWREAKAALRALSPRQQAAPALLPQAWIYEMTRALGQREALLPEEKADRLRSFLTHTPEFYALSILPEEVLDCAGCWTALCEEAGSLDYGEAGTFWQALLSAQRQAGSRADDPEALLLCFGRLCQYCAAEEDSGRAALRAQELSGALEALREE